MKKFALLPLVAVVGLACAGAGEAPAPAPRESYVGQWNYNANDSESFAPRETNVRRGSANRGMGRARPPGSMGPDVQTEGERQAMAVAMRPSRQLGIEMSEAEVRLTDGDRKLILPTDGSWVKDRWDGVDVDMKAEWQRGVLHLERRYSGGVRVRENFTFDPKGRLVIETSVSAPSFERTRVFKRVFDRAGGAGR